MQGRLSPAPHGRRQAFPSAWADEFERAREVGLSSIEWLVTAPSLGTNPLLSATGVSAIRRVADRTGVAVPSVCADFLIALPLVRVPAPVRAERLALLDQVIAGAAQAGARVIIVPVLEENRVVDRDEARALIRALEACLLRARRLCVSIAIESDLSAEQLRSVVDEAAGVPLCVCYDVGNATAAKRDAARELRLLQHRVGAVHLKDRRRSGPSMPLGDGDVDFDAVLGALHHAGYNGPLTLETPHGPDSLASARANLAFLQRRASHA